jgi:hypothetical protein
MENTFLLHPDAAETGFPDVPPMQPDSRKKPGF